MIYKKVLTIPKDNANYYDRLLTIEPKNKEDCFDEDSTVNITAVFEDGTEMDVKICGVQFEYGKSNLPWTEAVLFKNGCECGCSEPSDEFFGEWEMSSGTDTYIAIVRKE